MRGLLISFDGVDSSGKATQAKMLVERLRFQGRVVRQFQSPDYSTPSGQKLKKRLQGKLGNWAATPWQEKMKYFAENRAEHRDEVLAALNRGEIVVYDRYVPSSVAFIAQEALGPQMDQMFRQKVCETVQREEYEVNSMPREDASIFLDVPPHVSTSLLEKRKEVLQDEDEYTDHVGVQQRLYNEYDLLMEENPEKFLRISCVSGTQLLSIDDIGQLVWESLSKRFIELRT